MGEWLRKKEIGVVDGRREGFVGVSNEYSAIITNEYITVI